MHAPLYTLYTISTIPRRLRSSVALTPSMLVVTNTLLAEVLLMDELEFFVKTGVCKHFFSLFACTDYISLTKLH